MQYVNSAVIPARGLIKAQRTANYLVRKYVTVRTENKSQFMVWLSPGHMVAYHILCELWKLRRVA